MDIYNNASINYDFINENKGAYKSYLQMDVAMKKLFGIKSRRPIIDFLNAIYGDSISYDAEISYSDKESINKKESSSRLISFYADMYITLVDGNNIYEYAIEFQTIFDKEIAVRIFRYSFERAVKLADYSNAKKSIKLKMPEPYIILIEEEAEVGDTVKLEVEFGKGVNFAYDIKVLRYWTYDLERLYKENMYLLYPLQIFKLRKRMNKISKSNKGEEEKRLEMFLVYDELKLLLENTLRAIDKTYEDDKIELNDYDEMNTVIENINSYFIDMYGKYREIDKEVKDMVKTFYDPRVEERGIEKGKVEGKIEEKKSIAKNMLLDGEDDEKIKRYTGLEEEEIKNIKKLIEVKGEH